MTTQKITKKKLADLVAKRIDHQIHYIDINSVLSLFIDEFIQELTKVKIINIPNFCKFRLEQTRPRKFFNTVEKRFAISKGKFLIKINLSDKIKYSIINNLDLLRTFL